MLRAISLPIEPVLSYKEKKKSLFLFHKYLDKQSEFFSFENEFLTSPKKRNVSLFNQYSNFDCFQDFHDGHGKVATLTSTNHSNNFNKFVKNDSLTVKGHRWIEYFFFIFPLFSKYSDTISEIIMLSEQRRQKIDINKFTYIENYKQNLHLLQR